jgi:hypothetical protein
MRIILPDLFLQSRIMEREWQRRCEKASSIGYSDTNIRKEGKIVITYIPYILESNPHPFYGFRGLKNQMRIRIECGLDSRSKAGFWKNDRAGVRAVKTIQLFIILFVILYNI